MDSKKTRTASKVDEGMLYRMDSLTPAMMNAMADDNMDDMISSDEEN
jgi:hypothetical protein